MAVITGGHIIEGSGLGKPILSAAAPVNGTDEIQTITFGGTPTGGTFRLTYDGFTTGDIAWSATNATLVANILAALVALPNIGAAGVAVAVGTMTAGIGTITVTFSGAQVAKRSVATMTVAVNALTGTSPTIAVAETTPGVDATGAWAPKGAQLVDMTNGIAYINTGTAAAPTWTKVGTQT